MVEVFELSLEHPRIRVNAATESPFSPMCDDLVPGACGGVRLLSGTRSSGASRCASRHSVMSTGDANCRQ